MTASSVRVIKTRHNNDKKVTQLGQGRVNLRRQPLQLQGLIKKHTTTAHTVVAATVVQNWIQANTNMEESWGGFKAVCEAHLRRWRRVCGVRIDRACHCCSHFRVDLIRSQTRRSLVACWHYSKTDHCAAVVVVGRVIVVVVLSTTSVLLCAERRAPCIGPQTANLQTHTRPSRLWAKRSQGYSISFLITIIEKTVWGRAGVGEAFHFEPRTNCYCLPIILSQNRSWLVCLYHYFVWKCAIM